MITVYFRIFIKLFVFAFVAFFIIFFVVYGYRYDKNIGFMKKNVYIEYKFWSDYNSIQLNGKKYYSDDKFIKIYNMDNGCYNMQYMAKTYLECFNDDQSYTDVYINSFGLRDIGNNYLDYDCDPVQNQYHQEYIIKNKTFSEKIKNAFKFNNINFVQFEDKIKYCNDSYTICKDLDLVKGDVICGSKKGLIFYNTGYTLLNLK